MTPPVALGLRRAAPLPRAEAHGLALGLTVLGLALPALLAMQYALPAGADARFWGLNPPGLRQFQSHLGLSGLAALPANQYSLLFRLLLLLVWTGYALSVLSALRGAALRTRPLLLGIVLTSLLTAVFAPPLLSHDVYAYAAHGRLFALFGQNPYLCHASYLRAVHDPAASYVTWDSPSVYGPVWTRTEIASVALLRPFGLWPQVVALKLVEALALIGAALAGRGLARRLSPGRENLVLFAIGLNPLLLLEGPGSGHNDLLLVCFLLLAALLFYDGKYLPAALLLGVSVGIKPVTLAVLPWALMEYGRGRPWRQTALAGLFGVLLVSLPTLVCFAGLWAGPATLAAMHERSFYHASEAALAQDYRVFLWMRAHGIPNALASQAAVLFQDRLVVLGYTALTLRLALRPKPAAWLTAWALMASGLMFGAMGLPFPWYIAWFWPVCLLRWDRLGLTLSAACFALSLVWVSGYGLVFVS